MKTLYIDMDNVLVDFASAFPRVPRQTLDHYEGSLDDIPHIFSLMDPMPGAVAGFDKLVWVQQHLGEAVYKRLILTHHKHLNRGDFLVDDRTRNGADRFEGELILFGSADFPDWQTVRAYLLERC